MVAGIGDIKHILEYGQPGRHLESRLDARAIDETGGTRAERAQHLAIVIAFKDAMVARIADVKPLWRQCEATRESHFGARFGA